MPKATTCTLTLFIAFFTGLMAAQTVPSSTTAPPATARRNNQEPCWQQVGISQSDEQQRRQIEQNTHSQVEAVCGNSSLTQQQKQEQIHQIREQARSQVDGLLNSQQQQALRSCRAQRGEGRHGRGTRGENPCGGMTAARTRGTRPQAGQSTTEPTDSDTEEQ